MINLPQPLTKVFVIYLCVLMLFVISSCILSVYGHYERCSKPFHCGNHISLLYPFWMPGRQDCGHPDFMVDCNGELAKLNISSVKFRISEANYDSGFITLARLDNIGNLCTINETFPESILPFAPQTERLTIYYGCHNLSSVKDVKELVCEGNTEARTGPEHRQVKLHAFKRQFLWEFFFL